MPGGEDPLEKERLPGVATHSSILSWKILRTEEPDGVPWGRKET